MTEPNATDAKILDTLESMGWVASTGWQFATTPGRPRRSKNRATFVTGQRIVEGEVRAVLSAKWRNGGWDERPTVRPVFGHATVLSR